MFFFNGRIRNAHIIPIITRDRTYTHKVGQSGIIFGCLLFIIGLMFIVIGAISETEKPTFFRIGIIILSVGFCFTTLICFYTKLGMCYNNWAYGSHITPSNMENSITATAGDISVSYLTGASISIQKAPSVPRAKMISNVKVNKIRTIPAIESGQTVTNK